MKSVPRTLKFKVGLYMAATLTMAMAVFIFLVVRHQREELREAMVVNLAKISEIIIKSTSHAMLKNEPVHVKQIVKDVGKQENIEKVRIWTKDGTIIYSSYLPEVGKKFDRDQDGCVSCYPDGDEFDERLNKPVSRIFFDANGRRMLGSMEAFRNEPSCYTASCHAHDKSERILGVLDVVYSLDTIDKMMQEHSIVIGGASFAFIALLSLLMSSLVSRLVYRPLTDLEAGARRLSSGDLEHLIPERSTDEFGQVAKSFNSMTRALKSSQEELQAWALTLERKVNERTQELRIAEAEKVRSEKLASVGLLAAGIAHELNNPLTGVLTFSHLLRQKMPDGSQDAEDLDLVIRETKRCAAIIRRLLDFARDKPPENKFSDLNRIVENTIRIIDRPAFSSGVPITLDLDSELPAIWVDADQIEQVVMNIAVNAQHAVEKGGRITIRTRRVINAADDDIEAHLPMVKISIEDTGCGISEENLKRIFDPFFTSKEVGKGTGLGLSVSYGIISAHGGRIEVESQIEKGTTFRIFLPVSPASGEDVSSSSGREE